MPAFHPPTGAHILQIYLDDRDRETAQAEAVGAGLLSGERVLLLRRDGTGPLPAGDPALYRAALAAGGLRVLASLDHYLEGGRFDPVRALDRWRAFCLAAVGQGAAGGRAVGDVPADLERLGGAGVLVRYEHQLNAELRRCPPSRMLCQYDARAFSGAVLAGVVQAHPWVLVAGRILANPFYRAQRVESCH